MITIISVVLKATLVITAALVGVALTRHGRASSRHALLAASFVTLLMLPIVPQLLPATTMEVPMPALVAEPQTAPAKPLPSNEAGVIAATEPAIESSGFPWMTAARNVYFGGVLLLLASLAAGLWRLRTWANHAEIWPEGTRIAAEVANESGIRRAVLVVTSNDVAVPLTFGFRRQTIVMPGLAGQWNVGAVRRAIRHELEHVRRDDWAMQLVARVACVLYWPHPMVWMAFRRFCVEAERSCDDAVVQTFDADAPTYAEQLVTLAGKLRQSTAAPVLAMASPSRLAERVRAILDPGQPRGPQSRTAMALIVSLMVAVLITFGSLQLAAAVADDSDDSAHDDAIEDGVAGAFDDKEIYRDSIVDAAGKGNLEALQFFADRGVRLDAAILGDGTPLLIASRAGRTETVRWLLDRGVDPNVPSLGDGNALIAAARAGQTSIMRMLLDRGARIEDVVPGDENALITAAAAGSVPAVKLLIERGANVNSRVWANGREWRTPLSMARRYRHDEVERILMEAGARQ